MSISKANMIHSHTPQPKSSHKLQNSRPERQVESLSTELHSAQEAAATHSAKVLRLQSTPDAQTTTQTDFARHEEEEVSWYMLRTKLTRQRTP
jgi:hypothetical protein